VNQVINRAYITEDESKTIFELANNYQFIIHRQEALSTWSIHSLEEGIEISALGDGSYEKKPSYKNELPSNFKPLPKDTTPTREFYKEDMPISIDNVQKIIYRIQQHTVQEVGENSGISFDLTLTQEGNNRKTIITVDSDWELYQDDALLLNSVDNKFKFVEELFEVMKNKKFFDMDIREDTISLTFSENIFLYLKRQESRFTTFSINLLDQGIYINNYPNGEFTHIIICPDGLREKYLFSTQGSSFTNLMYALDFYRDLVDS
jgi:hypothetical protein